MPESSGNAASQSMGDAESDALDPQLAELLAIWPTLSPVEKARVLRAAVLAVKRMG